MYAYDQDTRCNPDGCVLFIVPANRRCPLSDALQTVHAFTKIIQSRKEIYRFGMLEKYFAVLSSILHICFRKERRKDRSFRLNLHFIFFASIIPVRLFQKE